MLAAIHIGGLAVSTYYLILLAGILGMFLCICKRRTFFSLNIWQCGAFTALLTAVGVAGAMLLFFLESGSFGGVSFFGSVYLIPLVMPLVGMLFRLRSGQTMDVCGPCVAIMIGCMRVNCFLSGCCGGVETCLGDFCFSWPTQALDSIGDFAILFWLLRLEAMGKAEGTLYPLFMLAYGTMRFLLEFLRDTPKDWLYLSHGQWFALISILCAATWTWLAAKNLRNVISYPNEGKSR